MGFLDGYEASLERLTRWNTTYPMGRIETRIVEFSAEKRLKQQAKETKQIKKVERQMKKINNRNK